MPVPVQKIQVDAQLALDQQRQQLQALAQNFFECLHGIPLSAAVPSMHSAALSVPAARTLEQRAVWVHLAEAEALVRRHTSAPPLQLVAQCRRYWDRIAVQARWHMLCKLLPA
jgi:hypothetical protein